VKLGPQEQLIDKKYLDICKELLLKAHQKGVKIILPTDFVTLSKPKVGHSQEPQEENEENKEEASPEDEKTQHIESTIEAVGEVNWIDLIYDDGCENIDFTNFIEKKLDALLNSQVEEQKEDPIDEQENAEETENQPPAQENHDEQEPEGEGQNEKIQEPEPAHELQSKSFILEFGQNTMQNFLEHTKDAMKIFWDGSISLYPDTFAHENNKSVTLDFMRIKGENEDLTEPKYTLVHSQETDTILNQCASKIKLEQMENKDAENSMGEGYNESGSMTSTFQQDNTSPSIFVCAEGRFTMQILQGIENRCLMNMNEHSALTQDQIEDDLSILDDI